MAYRAITVTGVETQPASAALESAGQFASFRRRLKRWFGRHGRDLPWRRGRSLYRVWVSEIMLQQTQVATVIPYYRRFLARFPSLSALASADESDVLRLWEGLGYYRRARFLHRAANLVVADHGGRIPRTPAELQALPGIGRYTAAAILSFALDQRHPILEANTKRLYSRLLGAPESGKANHLEPDLWEFADRLLPRTQIGAWNDALMDVGSLLCTPQSPDCPNCPLRQWCVGFQQGSPERLGRPAAKPAVTKVRDIAVLIRRDRSVLMRKRGSDERWAGLWDFVRFTAPEEMTQSDIRADDWPSLERKIASETGVDVMLLERLPTIRHSVTRYRITLECLMAHAGGGTPQHGYRWMTIARLEQLPLSTTARKLAQAL